MVTRTTFACYINGCLEKTTAIRRIAVRETNISRHHRDQLMTPWSLSDYHSTIVLMCLRGGPLAGRRFYRESLVSLTDHVSWKKAPDVSRLRILLFFLIAASWSPHITYRNRTFFACKIREHCAPLYFIGWTVLLCSKGAVKVGSRVG